MEAESVSEISGPEFFPPVPREKKGAKGNQTNLFHSGHPIPLQFYEASDDTMRATVEHHHNFFWKDKQEEYDA